MRAHKKRRLYLVLACEVGLGSATALSLAAFASRLTYFSAPRDILQKHSEPGISLRLDGIVQASNRTSTVTFRVTDGQASIPVTYSGILLDLFHEGQGVVAIGEMRANKTTFTADEVLAKHGASYMPIEVAQALKSAGKWNPKYVPTPDTWNIMAAKNSSWAS